MKRYFAFCLLLVLPGCWNNSKKELKKNGELSFKAEVKTSNDESKEGILVLKDWKDRVFAAYDIKLSCVTPGLASMPNPMPSIGSYKKADGGRCYIYIKNQLDLNDERLKDIEKHEFENNMSAKDDAGERTE